jgi:Family of unknown function (DUF5681)
MIGGRKWQKGESGNLSGRPKSNFSFKKELELKLGEINERDYLKRTYGRIMIDRVVELASRKNPSIRAVSEILDRVLGKPVQAVATLDLNVTREQRLVLIEDLLSTLPKPTEEADGPSDPRVN